MFHDTDTHPDKVLRYHGTMTAKRGYIVTGLRPCRHGDGTVCPGTAVRLEDDSVLLHVRGASLAWEPRPTQAERDAAIRALLATV